MNHFMALCCSVVLGGIRKEPEHESLGVSLGAVFLVVPAFASCPAFFLGHPL